MTNPPDTGSQLPFPPPKEGKRLPLVARKGATRIGSLILIYSVVIFAAMLLAWQIRFEFRAPPEQIRIFWQVLLWFLPVQLLALLLFGQFNSMLSYFSLPDARRILFACGSSSTVSVVVWYATEGFLAPPRSIILIYLVFSAVGLISVRLTFRMLRERFKNVGKSAAPIRRMAIVGAGDVGADLVKEMQLRRGLRMDPVAFFDDDRTKWDTQLHGVPVLGAPELLKEAKFKIDEVVIAMPGASKKRIREVVHLLTEVHLKSEIVPSMEQLMNGAVKVSQIRPVEIEDLLGREPVSLETEKIRELVQGKVVAVTGAGGSIGSELCRQIAAYHPLRLLLIERCEFQLFQIEQELIERGYRTLVMPLVADVLDEERMQGVFERYTPNLVFHAAAHKHVPLMEHQPYEAVRNNAFGTRLMANLCRQYRVERFILISTDKAINPTSVMGASKRLAEIYLQASQNHDGNPTKFMAVRFGNVLGSSGSAIPTFKRQIAAGGPVTVTHPDMTRYFMTVSEAVGLVLQSATQGRGGEIFVLDMGKPVKIVDVARQLIELSGLQPDADIAIEFTGLRPGEKLYEEINHNTENMVATDHPKIMRFVGRPAEWTEIVSHFGALEAKTRVLEPDQVKLEIQKLIPEYRPYLTAR